MLPRRPRPCAADHPVRRRILQAAEARFLAEGFHRVTMDELAAELGISKKTLYQHVRGKLELLGAVIDLRLATMASQLDAVAHNRALDFTGRLSATLDVITRRLAEIQPPFLRDLQRYAPDAFRRIEQFRGERVLPTFGRLLAEGRRQGMVRADLEETIVTEILLQLVQRTIRPETIVRLGVSPAAVFGTILSLFLEGVMTTRGRAARRSVRRRNPAVRRGRYAASSTAYGV